VPKRPSKEFCAELGRDPLVVEWFVSLGENEGSRKVYLWWFAVFCLFTGWTPQEIIDLKRRALLRAEPKSEVENALRRFYSVLCSAGYAKRTCAVGLTACYSFLNAHGSPVPRKLIHMSYGTPKEIRFLEREEIENIISQAGNLEKAVLFTVMAECPARARVFPEMQWGWLEEGWYKLDIAHISLPTRFRPHRGGGSIKFEPICYVGPRGIIMLEKLHDDLASQGRPPTPNAKIFPSFSYPQAINFAVQTACARVTKIGVLRETKENEEKITPKSFRKSIFDVIDSLEGISPEWRSMLKGRDLGIEKYYSKENIEALRKIYREKVYPAMWGSSVEPR
jgi:integrase